MLHISSGVAWRLCDPTICGDWSSNSHRGHESSCSEQLIEQHLYEAVDIDWRIEAVADSGSGLL